MKKIYNNESDSFADWTTKKLKDEAISYDELIYGENSCYGKSDLFIYSGIMKELEDRNISVRSRLSFN